MLVRASLLAAVVVLALALVGCGGGSAATNEAVGGAARPAGARRSCDVAGAEGELYSAENDLRGMNGSLLRALEGKKTLLVEPGRFRIRSYSQTVLHSIYREVRDVRRTVRSC